MVRTLCLALGLVGLLACSKEPVPSTTDSHAGDAAVAAVTALGRLEPGQGVVEVGAPAGDRLDSLMVDRGARVEIGEVLAVLESHGVRRAELELSEASHAEAAEALRRVRRIGPLGVKTREAEVRRLQADLDLAVTDLERTRVLVEQEVLPHRELDAHRSRHAQALASLEQGQSVLEQERQSARLEIRGAETALARAVSAVDAAAVRLERTEIRAPVAGAVLDLLLLPGEATHGGSILTLGEVSRMVAVAEVYETDARFVEVGQAAEVTSPALPAPLRGTVESVGSLVRRNDVLSLDPAARTDVRVIEMRIRLEDPQAAQRFVHLQVDIRIDTGG